MTNYKEALDNVNGGMTKVAKGVPQVMGGFMKLHDVALKNNALGTKTKELIALGISIAIKCEPCIVSHLDSLIGLDVTREEILDTISVAICMGGGPAVAYSGKVLDAYDEFISEKLATSVSE